MIPEYTKEAINKFVKYGLPPGSFITAVLENNLSQAFAYADETNTLYLKDIVMYVHWEIPGTCHGSPEAVRNWLARKIPKTG